MSEDRLREPIPFYRPTIGNAEIDAVVATMRSGWLTMGPKTLEFEKVFAEWTGTKHAIAVNSATSGLHLGLDASGIGVGDEVLVPTITFASTASTVVHRGAFPRLVDVSADTFNIDVEDARRKCGPKTKMIVPVHFAGHPCPMDEIQELASEKNIAVMEDAAHALPAAYRTKRIGSISALTVFSFYATKNLTTGEGGMVTTDDDNLAALIRSRRLHGMNQDAWRRYTAEGSWRYDVSYPGYKYNMTDVAASIGLVQMTRLEELQTQRKRIISTYYEMLEDVVEIELPHCRPEVNHAWHLFVVRVRIEMLTIGRDSVIQQLNAAGIGTSVHFIPLHEHSYYRDVLGYRREDFPVANAVFERVISLPLFPGLERSDIERIVATLRDILGRHRK